MPSSAATQGTDMMQDLTPSRDRGCRIKMLLFSYRTFSHFLVLKGATVVMSRSRITCNIFQGRGLSPSRPLCKISSLEDSRQLHCDYMAHLGVKRVIKPHVRLSRTFQGRRQSTECVNSLIRSTQPPRGIACFG
jgi:hypothetical protein